MAQHKSTSWHISICRLLKQKRESAMKMHNPYVLRSQSHMGIFWKMGSLNEKSYEIRPLNTIAKFFSQSLSVAQEFWLSLSAAKWSHSRSTWLVLGKSKHICTGASLKFTEKNTNYYLVKSFLFLREQKLIITPVSPCVMALRNLILWSLPFSIYMQPLRNSKTSSYMCAEKIKYGQGILNPTFP